jgi:hypothetical protein
MGGALSRRFNAMLNLAALPAMLLMSDEVAYAGPPPAATAAAAATASLAATVWYGHLGHPAPHTKLNPKPHPFNEVTAERRRMPS